MKEKIIYLIGFITFIVVLIGLSIVITKKEQRKEIEKENSVTKIKSTTFEKEVLNSDKKVLIDFYADWCGPCKMVSPIVAEIGQENKNIKVVKINIDDEKELTKKYKITSIPTLVVIKNGKEITRGIGALSKQRILELISKEK